MGNNAYHAPVHQFSIWYHLFPKNAAFLYLLLKMCFNVGMMISVIILKKDKCQLTLSVICLNRGQSMCVFEHVVNLIRLSRLDSMK